MAGEDQGIFTAEIAEVAENSIEKESGPATHFLSSSALSAISAVSLLGPFSSVLFPISLAPIFALSFIGLVVKRGVLLSLGVTLINGHRSSG